MAGSRLEKLGTIFSRMTGLIRSRAIKYEDRPLWYDVYESFPPRLEPCSDRPPTHKKLINIVYQEDFIRARFYKQFGSPGLIDLNNPKSKTICQIFVEEYQKLEKEGTVPEKDLFDAATQQLVSQGVKLQAT